MRPDGGRRGERLAGRWLRRRGFRVLGRNIRHKRFEIDLLAVSPCGRCLVVVEVKSGAADVRRLAARVDAGKRRRLAAGAAWMRRELRSPLPVRFDVVLVDFGTGRRTRVHHLPGAFDASV